MLAKKQGHVTVVEKLCKACGICIALCPAQVFVAAPDGRARVADQEKCTACRICEMHCPDFCVEVEEIDNE